jgi:hypothetical protein
LFVFERNIQGSSKIAPDELSKKAPELNLPSMYMAPHDEKAVSIYFESELGEAINCKSKDKIESYLLI